MGMQDKLYQRQQRRLSGVLVWWIACLWIDEPGAEIAAEANPSNFRPPRMAEASEAESVSRRRQERG